jgi:hypothetical protein
VEVKAMTVYRRALCALVLGSALLISGCDPAQLADPAQQTAPTDPATVQTLGPTSSAPAIAQALANGQPVDIVNQDPNGNWVYSVQSKGKGDVAVSFQLGGKGQGAAMGGAQAPSPASIRQQIQSRLAQSRAASTQRRQAHQQRLAQMKARAAQAATDPNALPIKASFNLHIDGNFDAEALKAQLAKLQQVGQGQPLTGQHKGLTWTIGRPQGATATASPSGVVPPTPTARPIGTPTSGAASPAWHVATIPVTAGPKQVVGASPTAAPVAIPIDDDTRDAVEETAELYLWLGAKGDLDEARDLVVERCLDGPVGQVQAVTFLDQPLELTESQVNVKTLRSAAATVAYDVTGTLTQEGEAGAIASSVNLTGELELVQTDTGWLISCPE